MIRKSPCERYLKYLIVRHERLSDEQIIEICRRQELDFIGGFYLRQLRAEMQVPLPFYPEIRTHLPSLRFLMAHGLLQFYQPDVHMRAASKLLEHMAAKEQLETMVISKAPLNWVVSALRRLNCPVSPEAVECYKQHYFDLEQLNQVQIKAILQLRSHNPNPQADPELLAVEAALDKARRKDPRMQAANAPIPQLAAMVSALRIGIRPENSALANMASSARTLALLRMLEAGMRDGFDDPMRASQWASMAKVSGEILSDVGSPEADFNSKLQDIALKTEEAPVPLLGVLSGGQHTANMETEDDSEERTSGGSRGGPGSPSEAPPSR